MNDRRNSKDVPTPPGQASRLRRAACYVRSATTPNESSIRNQVNAIVRYADGHGMQLVRLYGDEGKSGLSFEGRTGIQRLFRDIEDNGAGIDAILLHDVSRWGRSQNPDEGACLEFRCRSAGVEVHYCAASDDG